MAELRITIPGAPRTKKNHGRLLKFGGRLKMVPSASWCSWRNAAVPPIKWALKRIHAGEPMVYAGFTYLGADKTAAADPRIRAPLAHPVNCRALFYRDRAVGDAVGFYQGVADLLQEAGVLVDDVWIVSWDGSRLLKDSTCPRVDVVLSW